MSVRISIPLLRMKSEFSAITETFQYGFLHSTKNSLIKIQFVLILPSL